MAIKIGTAASNTMGGTSTSLDYLSGGAGNDKLSTGTGIGFVDAGFGDDVITIGSGNAQVRGGAGMDQVNVSGSDWTILPSTSGASTNFEAVLVNLRTGQTVDLTSVEKVKIGNTVYALRSGGEFNSTLTGSNGADFIRGLGGNDTITTGDGNDWVSGGSGNDTISTGSGNDVVDEFATRWENGIEEHNTISTGSGLDTIRISSPYTGDITFDIDGGSDNDLVYVNGFGKLTADRSGDVTKLSLLEGSLSRQVGTLRNVEQVVEAASNQVLTLVNGDWVEGRKIVNGSTGMSLSEDIFGNGSANTLTGGGGFDRFHGGGGTDTVVLKGRAASWNWDYGELNDTDYTRLRSDLDARTPMVDIFHDVEKIRFTNGAGTADDATYTVKKLVDKSLTGVAGEGNDLLLVQFDGDYTASQRLFLKGGDDYVMGKGEIERIDGGSGDDIIDWGGYADGALITGGDGNDQIDIFSFLLKGASDNTELTVDGGNGNDTIRVVGTNNHVKILGGAGADIIDISQSATVDAGSGNDLVSLDMTRSQIVGTIDGGSGTDILSLGISSDFIIKKSGAGYTVTGKEDHGTASTKNFEAIAFTDRALDLGAGFTTYSGSSASVTKTGGSGIDFMHGGGGMDTLNGGAGNDVLAGDSNRDTLNGGAGDDFLDGGSASDILTGGTGSDLFFFDLKREIIQGHDTITDFKSNDVIGIDAYESGPDSFQEVMQHATQQGSDTVITFASDSSITLKGVAMSSLVADDFYFF